MEADKPAKAKSYDRYKTFGGEEYSGMKVGASHKWYYDQGEWRERKVTPDEWNIYYQTTKRRAGKDAWNISEKSQRKKVIAYLQQIIDELREADEDDRVPWTVGEEDRVYGLEHWNKTELNRMAGEMGIPQRSKMSRGDLLAAIKERLYGPPSGSRRDSAARNRMIRGERQRAAKESAVRPGL